MDNQTNQRVKAYTKMIDHVDKVCKQKDDESLTTIDQAIDQIQQQMVDQKELTVAEAEEIAFYLRRDLHDMASFVEQDEKDLSDWLSFDWRLAEDRTWEMFLSVADKTRVELATFNAKIEGEGHYTASEITGIGSLECIGCGHVLHFYKPTEIPKCPNCSDASFMRAKD